MKRKREPSTESNDQEDEEMEEDEDKPCGSRTLNKEKPDEEESDEEEEEDSDDDDEDSPPPVELMVNSRTKRSTAGNKMAKLLHSTIQEDDFYAGAYEGGFKDDDVEDAYVSPHDSDDDEVDSDFDRPEDEDEPVSDHEEKGKEKRQPRKKTLYKEPKQKANFEQLFLDKDWAIDTQDKVAQSECDAKTQAQRMKEAEITEKENKASLFRFEEFEIERRKRREKAIKHARTGAYMSKHSTPTGNLLVLPEVKHFEAPHMPPTMVCAVTGLRARYRDPVTGLPYANESAFQEIRSQYIDYLRTIEGNPEVDEYLAQLDEESDSEDEVSEASETNEEEMETT